MKLFSYSLKNIFVSWRRSLSFGLFIFIITILLIFFNSFVMTVTNNMMSSMSGILTGDILVRPANDTKDIFSLNNNWEEMYFMSPEQIGDIKDAIGNIKGIKEYSERIRLNSIIASEAQKVPSIVMGINPELKAYKTYFKLVRGKYLNSNNSKEIMITEEQAKTLKVDVGDTVALYTQLKENVQVTENFKVVGIGRLDLLLSMTVAYVDLKGAASLMEKAGYNGGEVSDIMLFSKGIKYSKAIESTLKEELKKAGLSQEKVSVNLSEKMGGYIMSTIKLFVLLFYAFIGILMIIVSILIVNLVLMMGFERRQEVGTLRAIGFSKYKVVTIFINEIITITGIACTLGVAVGSALVILVGKYGIKAQQPMSFITGSEFYLKLDKFGILIVVLIVFLFSTAASLHPSLKVASLRPVDILKED